MNIQDQFLRESLLRLLGDSLSAAGADAQTLFARYGLDCSALDTWSTFALSDALNHIWADAEAETANPAVGLCIPRESGYGLGVVTHLECQQMTCHRYGTVFFGCLVTSVNRLSSSVIESWDGVMRC